MYSEEHPEAEKINQPTQELIDYLNKETEEGRLTPEQTRELLHLMIKTIEEQTNQFYL